MARFHPERRELEAREKQLLHEHRNQWGRPLDGRVGWGYHRGVPEELLTHAPALLLHNLPALFQTAPVRRVRIAGEDWSLPELLARPELARIDSFVLDN